MTQMPEIEEITKQVTKAAKDVAYVAVGLGVLGFQKAQVRRQEFAKQLSSTRNEALRKQVEETRAQLGGRVKELDQLVEATITKLEDRLEPLEQRLPDQAREIVKQARTQAKEARTQLRSFLSKLAA